MSVGRSHGEKARRLRENGGRRGSDVATGHLELLGAGRGWKASPQEPWSHTDHKFITTGVMTKNTPFVLSPCTGDGLFKASVSS